MGHGIDWQDDDDDDDVRQSLNQSWPVVQRLLLLVAGTLHFERYVYGFQQNRKMGADCTKNLGKFTGPRGLGRSQNCVCQKF